MMSTRDPPNSPVGGFCLQIDLSPLCLEVRTHHICLHQRAWAKGEKQLAGGDTGPPLHFLT